MHNQSDFLQLHHQLHAYGHIGQRSHANAFDARIKSDGRDQRTGPERADQLYAQVSRSHDRPAHHFKSSQVELSHKFSRPMTDYVQRKDEKKRATTLDLDRNAHRSTEPRALSKERTLSQSENRFGKSVGNSNEPPREEGWRTNLNSEHVHISSHCIQEEAEQNSSSRPSLFDPSPRMPPQELLLALDFTFFQSVYNKYNQIWQQVLKLPIYGQSYVQRNDFIRVLKACKVFDDEKGNAFCSFLLFSCACQYKASSAKADRGRPLLLLDYRLFLKSVFMTLKRQFNERSTKTGDMKEDSQDWEKIFHAEMFLVDHFWLLIGQSESGADPHEDQHSTCTGSLMNRQKQGGTELNSVSMELLERRLFEFFDRREPPFLLQINEVELLVTECYKSLIERNKRRDQISKRTFKKVVSRHCPGVLCRSLLAFVSGSEKTNLVEKPHAPPHNLTPFSLPPSSAVTDSSGRNGLGATKALFPPYGKVVDHNAVRASEDLDRKVMSQAAEDQAQSSTSQYASGANKDQKSSIEQIQNKPRQVAEFQKISRSNDFKKSKSQPHRRKAKHNLCKQLETKIVVQKLQRVVDSFYVRLAFASIDLGRNPLVPTDSSEESQRSFRNGKPWAKTHAQASNSSGSIEMPIEKSPTRASSQDRYVIPIQQINRGPKNNRSAVPNKANKNRPKQSHDLKQGDQMVQKRQREHRTAVFETKTSNCNGRSADVGNTELHSMLTSQQLVNQSCHRGKMQKSCECCREAASADVVCSSHLFSYHEAPQQNSLQPFPSSQQKMTRFDSSEQNFRTSSFQNQTSSQDQKSYKSLKQSDQARQQVPQDISDQKLPVDSARDFVKSDASGDGQNTTQQRSERDQVSTVEMLQNILKHETINQQCLQELVQRIESLERSSELVRRQQMFLQTGTPNVHSIAQSPRAAIAGPNTTNSMTFQPLSIDRNDLSQQPCADPCCSDAPLLPLMQDRGRFVPQPIDSQDEFVDESRHSSQSEYTHRQPHQEAMLRHAENQLQRARHQLAILKAQGGHSQSRFEPHDSTQYSHSIAQHLHHSQDADLCGSTAEGYCQEQFYEEQADGDREGQSVNGGVYDDYGDEMDFEANKEQRPLQIAPLLQREASMADYSGGTSLSESQHVIQSMTTMSDPYINTNVQSQVTSQQCHSCSGDNSSNPYVVSTQNSNVYSNVKRHKQSAPVSNQQSSANKQTETQQPVSLSYTISDSKLSNQERVINLGCRTIMTSAPNLKAVSSVTGQEFLDRTTVPKSNRPGDTHYDPHSYVQSEQAEPTESHLDSSDLITKGLTNQAVQELVYLRKYKKAKKHLKTLMREKRDIEDRAQQTCKDQMLLQQHLEKTAQTAQEVSNHNEHLQHELYVQRLSSAVRQLVNFKISQARTVKCARLRKALLKWHSQAVKVTFFKEQTMHQELILSELSRNENDFRRQLDHAELQLAAQQTRQRQVVLKHLIMSCARQMKLKAIWKWRARSQMLTDRDNAENLKEDLRQVVTQLNHFRLQLVCSKIKNFIANRQSTSLHLAFQALRLSCAAQRHQNLPRQPQSRPPQYKSPFMMHLTRNQTFTPNAGLKQCEPLNTTVESVCTVMPYNMTLSATEKEKSGTELFKRQKSTQSVGPDHSRSQANSKDDHCRKALAFQNYADEAQLLSGKRSSNDHAHSVTEASLLAPRQHLALNQRSKSDNRSVKKEDFRVQMDTRMQRMRQQGYLVNGLVLLHGLFTRAKQRCLFETRHACFTALLNHSVAVRRREENIKRSFLERQVFALTQKPPRSTSHNALPSQGRSSVSPSSLNSADRRSLGRNLAISQFKASTSSLQFGSQIQKGETPTSMQDQQLPERPRDRLPVMSIIQRREYPNLQQLRERRALKFHQRSGSENHLEPPRIMMSLSPSMNNISGPELFKSASTMQMSCPQRADAMSLKRQKMPAKPQRWMP